MAMNSECFVSTSQCIGCLRAVEVPSSLVPRLRLSGRVCISFSFGGNFQWICPPASPGPNIQEPRRRALFSLCSLWSQSASPSTSSEETPALPHSWSQVHSYVLCEIITLKQKYPVDYISQVCVWTLPRVIGQYFRTKPHPVSFLFMKFYPHEVKNQNYSFLVVPNIFTFSLLWDAFNGKYKHSTKINNTV